MKPHIQKVRGSACWLCGPRGAGAAGRSPTAAFLAWKRHPAPRGKPHIARWWSQDEGWVWAVERNDCCTAWWCAALTRAFMLNRHERLCYTDRNQGDNHEKMPI